jgi:Fe-S-cluster containining protein
MRTERSHAACARWEAPVDCQDCGACCREAYHSVTVSMRDPVVWQEPQLIVRHGARFEIRREGPRCAALHVDSDARAPAARYACTIYDNRPRPCREFAAGGRHCLDARRRVGLSVRADA